MFTNRIKSQLEAPAAVASSPLPAGFAVCQLPQFSQSPLALQLLAQQQAYEQALVAAREEALRIALSRLQFSLN
jgi:hypothetical protein